MLATSDAANSMQLVNLARITNKYQFRSIETWALSALFSFYSRPGAFDALPTTHPTTTAATATALQVPLPHVVVGLPGVGGPAPPPTSSPSPYSPSLLQITELAALCERADLLEAAVARWKRQIGEGKDVALAISVGERFNLRQMLGLAYHAMLLKGKPYWDADPWLTREQRVRLLCGYYSLGKMWDALPGQPPPVTHSTRCTSQQRCTKSFGALWKTVLETSTQVIPTLQREDMLGKVMLAESMMKALVEKEIPSQGFLDGMINCKENAMFATTMRVREIKDSLADHFSDEF